MWGPVFLCGPGAAFNRRRLENDWIKMKNRIFMLECLGKLSYSWVKTSFVRCKKQKRRRWQTFQAPFHNLRATFEKYKPDFKFTCHILKIRATFIEIRATCRKIFKQLMLL
ncbi:hypothetical protein AS034_08505 [[Bacillus] enclensis]|nr:hypothetical protein AS034_08505 [[Bacillus] enclensis]